MHEISLICVTAVIAGLLVREDGVVILDAVLVVIILDG